MANTDAPTGFKPIGHLLGLDWSAAIRRFFMTGATGNTFVYDLVDLAGSASTNGAYATVYTNTYAVGTTTYPILGSIVGFEPNPDDLTLLYRKTSTDRYALVCCDPFVIYEAQGSTNAVIAATAVGLNVCAKAVHSGSTTTGLSGLEIDSGDTTAPAAAATSPMLLLGAVDMPFNDISLVNAKWHVQFTMHRLLPNYSGGAYFGALGIS